MMTQSHGSVPTAVVASAEDLLFRVADEILDKGFCVVPVPQIDREKQHELLRRCKQKDFSCIEEHLEDSYLGREAGSKVSWISGRPEDDAVLASCPLFSSMYDFLVAIAEESFGFVPARGMEYAMLRQACGSTEGRSSSMRIDKHLDFLQRRRCCIMYFIACDEGSCVELIPRRGDNNLNHSFLSTSPSTVLVFRNDLLDYHYKSGGGDMVLQGWVLQEPRIWPGGVLTCSSQQEIEAAIDRVGGARMMERSDEVVITSAVSRLAGRTCGFDEIRRASFACADHVTRVPMTRWDHSFYYTDGGWEEAGKTGKATVEHSAFMDNEDCFALDGECFGMTKEESDIEPLQNMVGYQISYETFFKAGYNMKTIQGQYIALYNCSNVRDLGYTERLTLQRQCSEIGNRTGVTMWTQDTQKMAYMYGLRGPCIFSDTACSASNVAMNLAFQEIIRDRDGGSWALRSGYEPLHKALVQGQNFLDSPAPFVGLSMAHMLGLKGRSMTYDNSANGFCRGEGCSAGFCQLADDVETQFNSLATCMGGFINQDGRSASLTAPNGPSQTAVIVNALKACGRRTVETDISEMHGTGTALGDPIETGSLRAAMWRDRVIPLMHGAGKSMNGHHEPGAGIMHIIRVVAMGSTATLGPQCHLQVLNGNIDNNGYPALWPTECTDMGKPASCNGVSSFGFGGTNSRFVVWVRAWQGSRKVPPFAQLSDSRGVAVRLETQHQKMVDPSLFDVTFTSCSKCFGNMCWRCGEADDVLETGRHVCRVVRKEEDSYGICSNCYEGDYIIGRSLGNGGNPDRSVYIVGSWHGWTKYEEMELVEDSYVYSIDLGHDGFEQFSIVLDKDPALTVYPVMRKAGQRERIRGPDRNPDKHTWQIDIKRDCGMQSNGIIRIEFVWNYDGKSISWRSAQQKEKEFLASRTRKETVPIVPVVSRYSIVGSWNSWKFHDMLCCEDEDNVWETEFLIGNGGEEEFQFARHHDFAQSIYPAGCKVADSSVDILGPDDKGTGKNWHVTGAAKERVKVRLGASSEGMWLSVISDSIGERTWRTRASGAERHRYFLVGSFNNWSFSNEMYFDPLVTTLRQKIRISGGRGFEEAQIVVDEDWNQTLHPADPRSAIRGRSYASGPDAKAHDLNWHIIGSRGAVVEVSLHLSSAGNWLTAEQLDE